MSEILVLLLAAVFFDFIVGDPQYSYHPVRLIGKAIAFWEKVIYRLGWRGVGGGAFLFFATVFSVGLVFLFLRALLSYLHPWAVWMWYIFIVYSSFALRDLLSYGKTIASYLKKGGLEQAQKTVQMIVGRDTSLLDECGVARATIESLSENFVDSFFSPVFWFVVGGGLSFLLDVSLEKEMAVFGMLFFRTVNTLDSMVGYLSDKYLYVGYFSAKADDILNFIPARLVVPLMVISALVCGMDAKECLRVALRDRLKHSSPNAGHPESCMAGALGIRLGGPSTYPFGVVEKPWLGDRMIEVSFKHIYKCLGLILCAACMVIAVIVLSAFLL